MDFARKQLEKFGWKEGSGLGKDNQGMVAAIKPSLKVGKEGMGYDLSKELVDTWWTRAYDDSLKRINIEERDNESPGVTLKEDEDADNLKAISNASLERPFFKMRKRMMKASFPSFSKGATLSNGEMIANEKSDSSSDESESEANLKKVTKGSKVLTDEELLKACGGRTAHKAARFGLKLSGKLARIAAQEEAAKRLLQSPQHSPATHIQELDQQKPFSYSNSDHNVAEKKMKKEKKDKRKKKRSKNKGNDNTLDQDEVSGDPKSKDTSNLSTVVKSSVENEKDDEEKKKRKSKKHKKRKYEALVDEIADGDILVPTISENVETCENQPTISNTLNAQNNVGTSCDLKSCKSKSKKKNDKRLKNEG